MARALRSAGLMAEQLCSTRVDEQLGTTIWVGEAEGIVREAFADARSKKVPTILFIDEIDIIAGTRSVNGRVDVDMRVLATLLTEIDGVKLKRHVRIGTENMANCDVYKPYSNSIYSNTCRY